MANPANIQYHNWLAQDDLSDCIGNILAAGGPNARGAAGVGTPAGFWRASLALSPAAVAANTTAEQTFTSVAAFAGVSVGDVVVVTKPTAQAGLGIVGARVSAANQLAITFINDTAGAITPTAAEIYQFAGIR